MSVPLLTNSCSLSFVRLAYLMRFCLSTAVPKTVHLKGCPNMKRDWEELGPFPEYLYRSEDSWFNQRAEERGMRFRTARDAVVSWKPRANLKEVFRNSYLWVKSDIMNGVRMPFERNRAIRITLRLLRRVVLFDLWILVTLQE